ncbi:formate dehydrogenase, alpha subunit [Thermosinus carboxydivorans Nor1]|uniref:Formate dehydrogenase, alpha subunit n=1 Tax=Thermosinus carboxydivorans Nor1 TaxID=401526 RepID=A1HP73_9FIRM|nr:formate dehydrogenase-N subunit alpha [Thermosinus carboxydivorans]EAX48181.1 formate dehydrogenase, alpha subunit [Thermosinus carboxydivorans Nor1]
MASLAPSFGRGAMTNSLVDVANSDVIMICGGNPAENHPGVARFINRARERGAKVISVDPRYTRTSVLSDIYAPIRPGTDIVFFNGLVNYVLVNKKYFEPYVKGYTNASYLLKPEFGFKDGYFTGWDPVKKMYNYDTWQYQTGPDGKPLTDPTLEHPDSVFQHMRRFYARYTPEMVEKVTGMKKELFLKIAETYAATGAPDKSGCLLYAMGLTQHTVGVQNIRAFAVLQLLLGNMGLPGGGINAMRGEANVQGSTDMGLLYHSLPGYLAAPNAGLHPDLKTYLEKTTIKDSYWANTPKFIVSLLKAWWGDKAQKDNDFCYDWLPKWSRPHSFMDMVTDMYEGRLKGLMIWGMNPLVSGPAYEKTARGLEKLEWLLVVDLFESETARFWKRPGVDPKTVKTEVFLLPAASMVEKDGSATNTSRWLQMRYKAVEPIGDCKEDSVILHLLVQELKKLYAADPKAVFPDPIVNLTWNYGGEHHSADEVFKEINGYEVATRVQLAGFGALKDDGSTTSGCWIYSGMFPPAGNLAKRRKREKEGIGLNSEWGWAWPLNRRILYNRASCDYAGNPWSDKKYIIRWDAAAKKWTGLDVPDFIATTAPDAPGGTQPFIMIAGGLGRLFVPGGIVRDGPFPEHYEPLESPVKNIMGPVQCNPLAVTYKTDLDKYAALGNSDFPYICTTYRVAEHYQTGNITRKIPTTVEAVPEMFVEIDPELAKAKGITSGDWVEVASIRGKVRAKAFVTPRIQPFVVDGKKVHVVGLPWHWGFTGADPMSETKEAFVANIITPQAGDPNTRIPEYKAFMVNIRRV